MSGGRRQLVNRLADRRLVDRSEDLAHGGIGRGGEGGVDVAFVLLELALEVVGDFLAVVRRDPAAFQKELLHGPVHGQSPDGTSFGELSLLEDVKLDGDHRKEQVAIGFGGGHDAVFPVKDP